MIQEKYFPNDTLILIHKTSVKITIKYAQLNLHTCSQFYICFIIKHATLLENRTTTSVLCKIKFKTKLRKTDQHESYIIIIAGKWRLSPILYHMQYHDETCIIYPH